MKKNQIFLIIYLICNSVFAQSENTSIKKYPFTKANSIMIASFQNLQSVKDTLSVIECREIPKINGKINIGGFEKLVKLNKSEYQKLSNIIYSKSIEENFIGKGFCSETGYAILFFDKTGNVFEFIQFCYNCKTFKSSFAKDNLKNEDYEKMKQLKILFEENGIEIIEYRDGD